jgi:hypothetical protein
MFKKKLPPNFAQRAYTHSRPVDLAAYRSRAVLDEVILFGRKLNQRELAEVRLFMLRRSGQASKWDLFKAHLSTLWFRFVPA